MIIVVKSPLKKPVVSTDTKRLSLSQRTLNYILILFGRLMWCVLEVKTFVGASRIFAEYKCDSGLSSC